MQRAQSDYGRVSKRRRMLATGWQMSKKKTQRRLHTPLRF
jgi:hypothetical protein